MSRTPSLLVCAALLFACGDDGRPQDTGNAATQTTTGPGVTTTVTATDPTTTDVTTGDSNPTSTSDPGTPKLDLGEQPDQGDGTTGECAAQMLEPQVQSIGVDVVVVVDTSNSMQAAIAAVEASINVDFAAILAASDIDYRVIVLGDYPPGEQLSICISAPLSGTPDCNAAPPVPAVTERYKHYDAITGSGAFLANILAWYAMPDVHGLAPGGYRDFLRDGTRKVILAMTDGSSASDADADGDAFDAALLALDPPHFGTPGARDYVFHSIIGMDANNPPDAPWLPADPIQGNGDSIQRVSVLSGGWRFPLSQTGSFDVLFQEIAKDVVETTPIACSFPIPEPPVGEIDPNTIEIDYQAGGIPPIKPFHQVVDLAACEADAFYIENATVVLCPAACAEVQADPGAKLDIRYGCDVGFDPAG